MKLNLKMFDELAAAAKQGAELLALRHIPRTDSVWVPRVTKSFWKGTRDEGRTIGVGWVLPFSAALYSLSLSRTGTIEARDSSHDSPNVRMQRIDFIAQLRAAFDREHQEFIRDPGVHLMFKTHLEDFRYLRAEFFRKKLLIDELTDAVARMVAETGIR